jgi:NAD(P)-dependent dehydrogenase (short-subunit alcohol dehydrogenase family)
MSLNKTYLITGASSGIGKAVALELANQNARLILCGRNSEKLNHLIQSCQNPELHIIFKGDLTDSENRNKLVDIIDSIDGIVHSAGIVKPVPTKFINEKQIDEVFNINFKSIVLLNAVLLQKNKIAKGSSIVMISSISTVHPYFGGAIYVASKAAIEGYAKTLALELASKKIRVNVVQPALVKTEIYTATIESAFSENEMQKYEKQYPLGIGNPDDVSNMICFLLSEKSKWITGTSICMDGGLSLGNNKSL